MIASKSIINSLSATVTDEMIFFYFRFYWCRKCNNFSPFNPFFAILKCLSMVMRAINWKLATFHLLCENSWHAFSQRSNVLHFLCHFGQQWHSSRSGNVIQCEMAGVSIVEFFPNVWAYMDMKIFLAINSHMDYEKSKSTLPSQRRS